MSRRQFNTALAVAIGSLALASALAMLASRYADERSSDYLTAKMAAAFKIQAAKAAWAELRDGPVLGRLVDAKGRAAYLVYLRDAGGGYFAAVSVNGDGEPLASSALRSSPGFMAARRISSMFEGLAKPERKGDSPLDSVVQPLFDGALDKVAALERARTESHDGD